MDELLDRTPGTYKRFETGKLANPATERLCEPVAHALRFSETDWQGMWVYLFGHHPPRPLDQMAAQRVAPHWAKFLTRVGWASFVTDVGYNVIAYNPEFAAIFKGGIAPVNTMRWMLLEPEGGQALLNWDRDWAPMVMPQLKASVAAHPDHLGLRQLDAEVRADPRTRYRYVEIRDAYLQPDGDVRGLWHAGLGREVWVQIASAEPHGSPGARVFSLMFD